MLNMNIVPPIIELAPPAGYTLYRKTLCTFTQAILK